MSSISGVSPLNLPTASEHFESLLEAKQLLKKKEWQQSLEIVLDLMPKLTIPFQKQTALSLLKDIEVQIDTDESLQNKDVYYEKITAQYLNQKMWDDLKRCADKISKKQDPIYSQLIDIYLNRKDFKMILECVKKMNQDPQKFLSIAEKYIQHGWLDEAKELAAQIDFSADCKSKIHFYALLACSYTLRDQLYNKKKNVIETAVSLITQIFPDQEQQNAALNEIVILLKNYNTSPLPAAVKELPLHTFLGITQMIENYLNHLC